MKVTHKYSKAEQREFMRYARKYGDNPSTTAKLRDKFGITHTTAYYYRRAAFGYRRGQRIPRRVLVSAKDMERIESLLIGNETPETFIAKLIHKEVSAQSI